MKSWEYGLITFVVAAACSLFYWCGFRAGGRQVLSHKELGDSIVYRAEGFVPVFERRVPLERVVYSLPDLRLVDTVRVVDSVYVRVDTAAMLADYLMERGYELHFGSDTTGVFDVECVVALNRLQSYSATVVPVVRRVEAPAVSRKLVPWVLVGCSVDAGVQSLTAGLDINRWKVGVGGVVAGGRPQAMVSVGINF